MFKIELPEIFKINLSGQQTQGLQNNLGFEGLNLDTNINKWGAFAEGPVVVVNKPADHLLFIESKVDSPKVDEMYKYPLPTYEGGVSSMMMGVTEFLYLTSEELLLN